MAAASRGRPTKAEQQRKAQAEKLLEERKQRKRMNSIILFALSVFLFALSLIKGQSFWLSMHKILFGLFGVFAFGAGPLLFLLALIIAYDKKVSGIKTISALLLTIVCCGAIFIFSGAAYSGQDITFAGRIKELYLSGVDKKGGGVFSAVVGMPLLALFGHPGADITAVLLIFVFLMMLTGKSLIDLIEGVRVPVTESRERRREQRELLDEFGEETIEREDEKASEPVKRPAFDAASEHKNNGIDIPLSQKPSRIDIPLEPPSKQAEDTKNISGAEYDKGPLFLATRDDRNKPKTPEQQMVLSMFEQADRLNRKTSEIFASFPAPETEPVGMLDQETERLIKRVAGGYEQDEPPVKDIKPEKTKASYRTPSVSLLERETRHAEKDATEELRANADFLVRTLESFGVQTRVVDISRGPTVTRYELQPSAGVRLNRITNLADDIALNLATAGVRIEAPIPNKAAVGIEVPNKQKRIVRLRSVIESSEFADSESPLTVALGRDISGRVMVTDIAQMPHLLIAGTTGSGKSRCLHSMILSMIYKSPPEDLRFVIIDPKMVEFGIYNSIPHMLIPIVTDARKAAGALGWAVKEMLERYKLFSQVGVRDITAYNRMAERGEFPYVCENEDEQPELPGKLPRIAVIVDELADLMMASPREVEDYICRLAQMARAAGLHLIIATQRPSVDVITGVIKANISSRIALSVSSQIDSRTIIDSAGAEKLIGNGDMLFLPLDLPKPVRLQGCFVADEEIDKVVRELKKNAVEYDKEVLEEIERQAAKEKGGSSSGSSSEDGADSMLDAAIETVVESGQASTSFLQRRLKLGYARAARIMDEMEQMGIIGPQDGSKPRTVNMTVQQWHEMRLNREQG